MPSIYWLVFIVEVLVKIATACPVSCSCKWKNGKQTVSCTRKGLLEIPDGLDPETQVLDFTGNFMNSLPSELFVNKQLINLQRIYLPNCQIKKIDEKTFKGLTNLVELDLSGNLLQTVPTSSFVDCPSLMRLTLSSNPLKALKKLAFNHLSYLNTLELSNCQLVEIEEGAFQGLLSLEWLVLDENNLKGIRGRETLPANLKGAELRGNPWQCDCHIKDLFEWLGDFKIPITVEPTCRGPPRLADLVIRSIPVSELACLPDVSPTTFYLELAEGKNVSLQCHVHSVPEAAVSWWFRGQILQNNTIVAPGTHLIYFVEEGGENKRSELFIYNANSEDNGTFVCNAENAAGTSQSNFTIKIIIKEDPIVIIVSFPFEYLLAALIGAVALGLAIISAIIVLILRCRRRCRSQEKRSKTKDVAPHYQQTLKCEEISVANPLKTAADGEMTFFETHPCDDCVVVTANQGGSPTSLGRYQLEQNPDLINGMECRRENPYLRREIYEGCTMDVRWVDPEGYPIDYGLPKVLNQSANYYRTLPTNRMKRQSAPISRARYSQEAEFLARASLSPSPYDHYDTDVRYTVDGYPAAPPNEVALSSLPCCSVQWPSCVPANLHMINNNPNSMFHDSSGGPGGIIKRCVSAQTENGEEQVKVDSNEINSRIESANEALTESPDEGYGGEPSVV